MLMIKKNGLLVRLDDDKDQAEEEVDFLGPLLMERTVLDEGVVLRDVFMLVQKHIEFCSLILGRWTKEITTLGLKKARKPTPLNEIHFLEVYWGIGISIRNKKTEIEGLCFPEFHGYGPWPDDGLCGPDKEGPISVAISPVNKIAHLPLRLKKQLSISQTDYDLSLADSKCVAEASCEYTLVQILYAIYWELSFYGSPKKTAAFRRELISLAEQIDERFGEDAAK